MTDVALNILALIAGGLTLELFTSAHLFSREPQAVLGAPLTDIAEECSTGNPS